MNKVMTCLQAATICLILSASASMAQAQMVIRYVASAGSDANPCTRTAPCRSLQRGVDATPAGSELQVLDSAGYGPNITINKTITITAVGVNASIMTPSGTAITINAPGSTVVLRGLRLDGVGTGTRGIEITAAAAVHLEHCVVERFSNGPSSAGLNINTVARLYVSDCVFRSNDTGIIIGGLAGTNTGPFASITIEGTFMEQNANDGLLALGGRTTIRHSRVAGNPTAGIAVVNTGVQVTVDDCLISYNGDGIVSQAGPTVRVANSTITHNNTGLVPTGGAILSRVPASNTVEGNTNPSAFSGNYSAQ